jgi:hypothetical protein
MSNKKLPLDSPLKQLVSCGICYENYSTKREPFTSRCGHTFCQSCWENYDGSSCPYCRAKFQRRGVHSNDTILEFAIACANDGLITPQITPTRAMAVAAPVPDLLEFPETPIDAIEHALPDDVDDLTNIVENDVTVVVREDAELVQQFESVLSLDELRARRIEKYGK